MSSADNFFKQFRPRLGPTESQSWSGSKLFDTLIEFLKEFFEKVNFESDQTWILSISRLTDFKQLERPEFGKTFICLDKCVSIEKYSAGP